MFLLFFAMPHTKRYKSISLTWRIWYFRPIILPNNPEKHPIATLCFSTAAAAAPPSASHPRHRGRTALHRAALEGHAAVVEQLISAGATVEAANNDGRGPGRVFGSFWEWLWWGDGRGSYMASWFSCCALGCWVVLGLKRSLCHLSLELGLASWNSRKRNDRTWRGQTTWLESRSKHAVAECSMAWSVLWFGSWSQFNFKLK